MRENGGRWGLQLISFFLLFFFFFSFLSFSRGRGGGKEVEEERLT